MLPFAAIVALQKEETPERNQNMKFNLQILLFTSNVRYFSPQISYVKSSVIILLSDVKQ
jgi:hypothetical protein